MAACTGTGEPQDLFDCHRILFQAEHTAHCHWVYPGSSAGGCCVKPLSALPTNRSACSVLAPHKSPHLLLTVATGPATLVYASFPFGSFHSTCCVSCSCLPIYRAQTWPCPSSYLYHYSPLTIITFSERNVPILHWPMSSQTQQLSNGQCARPYNPESTDAASHPNHNLYKSFLTSTGKARSDWLAERIEISKGRKASRTKCRSFATYTMSSTQRLLPWKRATNEPLSQIKSATTRNFTICKVL